MTEDYSIHGKLERLTAQSEERSRVLDDVKRVVEKIDKKLDHVAEAHVAHDLKDEIRFGHIENRITKAENNALWTQRIGAAILAGSHWIAHLFKGN